MIKEYQQLDVALNLRLAAIQDRKDNSRQPILDILQQLALDRVALANENELIWRKIKNYTKFQHSIFTASLEFTRNSQAANVGDLSTASFLEDEYRKWCVLFPNGEPSFYFHPFTRTEFNSAITRYTDSLSTRPFSVPATGTLFSWTVHHSPLWRRQDDKIVASSVFTTRVNCGLEYADAIVTSKSLDSRPLLLTPPKWRNDQRPYVTTLVLQKFDNNSSVMVCNIPGDIHLRYFQLAQRQETVDEESGHRSVEFRAVMADSEANARNRAAEGPMSNVHWSFEGGHSLKLTYVDQGTIDIEYHHWAVIDSELHARHLYIQWAQYVTTFGYDIGTETKLIRCR
ncbi:hypothetical protein PHMEG_0003511 [Phytophthora megakarya]|uniref:Uncharacterized protein n=1 Tax=Phytophthora megakarya TaxID=4795 RepID=A0A225WWF5_9STRA|nr:hypothetical protein PHMEG_0003511 [Phytophthora megakarya]